MQRNWDGTRYIAYMKGKAKGKKESGREHAASVYHTQKLPG